MPGLEQKPEIRTQKSILPLPVQHFRHIDTVLMNVLLVFDQLVTQELFEMSTDTLQLGNPTDRGPRQMKAVEVIHHSHVERRSRRALLFVSPDMKIIVIVPPVSQAVNQPRITVISKDNRSVRCK